MQQLAYVNGSYVPHGEASVPVTDRGFLFGDGIYEVTSVIDGRMVDNDLHLERLQRSLGEIRIALPEPVERIRDIQLELIRANGLGEGIVYIQITRGAAERDFLFPPASVPPTLVMFTQVKSIVGSKLAETGARVITTPDIRWKRRDIKSIALLAQVLAKQEAARAGVADFVAFETQTIENLEPPAGPPGLVIVNPPYGGRIGDTRSLAPLYSALGNGLKQRFAGWRVGLVTTEHKLAHATGLPFQPPGPPVDHGGLRIRLFQTGVL